MKFVFCDADIALALCTIVTVQIIYPPAGLRFPHSASQSKGAQTEKGWMDGWTDGAKERTAELLIGLKIKKNPRTPPLHFLHVCSSSQPCSPLSKSGLLSNYRSFLSTPSLLRADVSAQGPFIREEERSVGEKSCARECVRGEPTKRQQAPARGLR